MSPLIKTRNNLRNNPTFQEELFRSKLYKWGVKFKFQEIIRGYIADFLLPEYDLVVEIDGSRHYTDYGLIRDKFRDAVLNRAGFTVYIFGTQK